MNKRSEDNIPNIVLDSDDVKAYKSNKNLTGATKSTSAVTETKTVKAKSSGLMVLANIVLYVAVGAGGYWIYQEDVKNKALLSSAEMRILDLEKQLSATGEEMGESTVALKAKLESLIKKTDTLWTEMDKLWASAWRKNQAQIKELNSKTIKLSNNLQANQSAVSTATKSINDIKGNITSVEFNVSALTEQLQSAQTLKADLQKLSSQYVTLENKSSQRDKSQLEVATSINQLEMTINALTEQIDRLKQATKTSAINSPNTPAS